MAMAAGAIPTALQLRRARGVEAAADCRSSSDSKERVLLSWSRRSRTCADPSLKSHQRQWIPAMRKNVRAHLTVKCAFGNLCARDRVIEFGKFKGSMMGTMSSKYLKWMAKNLKQGPMSHWAEYAEEVLEDPYYKDRLEWEKVEKLMTLAHDIDTITGNRDVLAPAKAFGWDMEDDSGWRKVNFSLLGTSQGGRIPRKKGAEVRSASQVPKATRKRRQPVTIRSAAPDSLPPSSSGSLREELVRRRELRRDRLMANRGSRSAALEEEAERIMHPFPGRDSILSKFRSYDISE